MSVSTKAVYPFNLGGDDVYKFSDLTHGVAEAATWFERGMVWLFAFHHEEAICCFKRALEIDSSLAMAHWGIAYAHGPNYNIGPNSGYYEFAAGNGEDTYPSLVGAEKSARAAFALRDTVSEVERALIDAVQVRTCPVATPCARHLLRAFAEAMLGTYTRFTDSADVALVYAESLMNLHAWDLWPNHKGVMRPEAKAARSVLELALKANPNHPGLLHLYIHLMELGPQDAVKKADMLTTHLRTLVPAAGHLAHMPSHLDLRLGHYAAAVAANRKAVQGKKKIVF
eukprot:UC1_evm1s153